MSPHPIDLADHRVALGNLCGVLNISVNLELVDAQGVPQITTASLRMAPENAAAFASALRSLVIDPSCYPQSRAEYLADRIDDVLILGLRKANPLAA